MRRSFFLVPLFLLGCAASPGPRFTETARERAEWNLSLARAHYERTQALFDPFFLQGRTGRPASPEAETEMRKSLAALDEAIRLDPGLAEPYRLRARLRSFRSENLEAALADYGEVLRRLPKDVDAHYERGLLYLDQEKPNLAYAEFDRAIELDPKHEFALGQRARLRADRGDPEGALADYTAAIRSSRWPYLTLHERAKLHRSRGDLRRALEDLDAALAGYGSEDAFADRAEILERLGQRERAARDRASAEKASRRLASISVSPEPAKFGQLIGGTSTSSLDCTLAWDIYQGNSSKGTHEETKVSLQYLPDERLHRIRVESSRDGKVTGKIDKAGICYFGKGDANLDRTFLCLSKGVELLQGKSMDAYQDMLGQALLSGRVRGGSGFEVGPAGSHVSLRFESTNWLEVYRYDENGKEVFVSSVRPETCRVSAN
jgi:tetratricopeptide (TPR) repeat protein